MKSLYITSVEPYSGKTAACLALGKRFIDDGYCVKYIKPYSLQPWRLEGKLADEDAAFAKEILGLAEDPWQLSPVVVTRDFLRNFLRGQVKEDLMSKVKSSCEAALQDCQILLLEGGGSLREGYVFNMATPTVAKELGSTVLVILRYKDEVHLLDDALAARIRLGEQMCGVIINRGPEEALSFVKDMAAPYLEKKGISVFGVLPEVSRLESLTVQELIDALNAQVITNTVNPNNLVENLTIGAMTADAALSRFRRQSNKAVITGGDRTDIQLAALETSTTCLILTGNMRPSPLIIKQADQFNVPILLVRENTLETVEIIERIFGKTRLGQASKLIEYEKLLSEHADIDRIYKVLGL